MAGGGGYVPPRNFSILFCVQKIFRTYRGAKKRPPIFKNLILSSVTSRNFQSSGQTSKLTPFYCKFFLYPPDLGGKIYVVGHGGTSSLGGLGCVALCVTQRMPKTAALGGTSQLGHHRHSVVQKWSQLIKGNVNGSSVALPKIAAFSFSLRLVTKVTPMVGFAVRIEFIHCQVAYNVFLRIR